MLPTLPKHSPTQLTSSARLSDLSSQEEALVSMCQKPLLENEVETLLHRLLCLSNESNPISSSLIHTLVTNQAKHSEKIFQFFDQHAKNSPGSGAFLMLGGIYLYGFGVDVARDLSKAVHYFQRAVELGSSEAAFQLAALYSSGDIDDMDAKLLADNYLMIAQEMTFFK